jgi:acyl carrier protein
MRFAAAFVWLAVYVILKRLFSLKMRRLACLCISGAAAAQGAFTTVSADMEQHATGMIEPDLSLEREIAGLIVSSLNLEITPESIQPEDPLYGDPLGLDSIDILEIALVLSKQFGVQMKADSDDNFRIFASLRALAAYIREHRTK